MKRFDPKGADDPQAGAGRTTGRRPGRISGLKLDAETEQTAKASYISPRADQKKLDQLRAAFRHEGGYAPRDASYSRIVGLAIERLHEEILAIRDRKGRVRSSPQSAKKR
jgi:hypothetical protein